MSKGAGKKLEDILSKNIRDCKIYWWSYLNIFY